MKPTAHGGDLRRMAASSGRTPASLLDFSVNVRPEGPPDFIRAALCRAMNALSAYPSPHAEEAVDAAARHHGINPAHLVFGNGSNELIHALARVLTGIPCAVIIEPAFSEYALACEKAGIPILRMPSALCKTDDTAFLARIPHGAAVFFANPGNPSGDFMPREQCYNLFTQRPDCIWIVDEAFIEYVDEERVCSLLNAVPEQPNWVILRSLTKFHAVPGVRLGYVATGTDMATRLRAALPAWTVNAFALAAACAVFADTQETADFAVETRRENAERRADLVNRLHGIRTVCNNLCVFPSAANYVLFRWTDAPSRLSERLLREYGIAVRDCSNYHGMEDGTWFRVAVRFPEDHATLVAALVALNELAPRSSTTENHIPVPVRKKHTPALMLQGTSSNAGKSVLAAAYCRILHQDGYAVAPFKAQNMSLNSGVTATGQEMGRAQIVQAQACRTDPDARMNPILLKPHSDTGSQVIVLGEAIGHMGVHDYFRAKKGLWDTVTRAYDELAADHDLMVLEGAGSPGEINLKSTDVVNMSMATHAKASVLLVGDIDRGGVYASFLGTWMTFTPPERRLLTGFLVNRFRGDASLLDSAHSYMQEHTGVPVLGVVPHVRNLNIPEEDSLNCGLSWDTRHVPDDLTKPCGDDAPGKLDIAVIMLRHVSNQTDFAPLALEPDVRLRAVRCPKDWGNPDIVMLPGSKSVVADLHDLHLSGLDSLILAHAEQGKWVFGICGGLQIMGQSIADPYGIESTEGDVAGLGLLDLRSTFARGKILVRVDRAETPLGVLSSGYEIHHGLTEHGKDARPLFRRIAFSTDLSGTDPENVCGYVTERRWATYLHGIFDDDAFRRAFLDHVRQDVGLTPQGCQLATYDLERALDRLADIVRASTDMNAIYRSMGLK